MVVYNSSSTRWQPIYTPSGGGGVESWSLSVPLRQRRRLPEIVICVVNIKLRTINQYYLSQVILISSIRSSAVQEWSGFRIRKSVAWIAAFKFDCHSRVIRWDRNLLLCVLASFPPLGWPCCSLWPHLMYARLGRLTLGWTGRDGWLATLVSWPGIRILSPSPQSLDMQIRNLLYNHRVLCGDTSTATRPDQARPPPPPLLELVRLITYTAISPSKVIVQGSRPPPPASD